MIRRRPAAPTVLVLAILLVAPLGGQQSRLGYYRFPSIWHDTIVFTAEGDLWRVPTAGGVAQRLTSHPAQETRPAIAPDGKTVVYSAMYEGPTEVYTLPAGGRGARPADATTGAGRRSSAGRPRAKYPYSTSRFSGLPNAQLVRVDLVKKDANTFASRPGERRRL